MKTWIMWQTTITIIMLAPQWCKPRISDPAVSSVTMYFRLL